MSISISQTDNVGLTVESDPLALKKASNLSDLTDSTAARTNLSLSYSSIGEALTNNPSPIKIHSAINDQIAQLNNSVFSIYPLNWVSATSGTGASVSGTVHYSNRSIGAPNALTVGYAAISELVNTNAASAIINFDKPIAISSRLYTTNTVTTNAGLRVRHLFTNAGGGFGIQSTALTAKGFGWEYDYATLALSIITHNGTSQTSTTVSGFTLTAYKSVDITVYSDGSGNVSLYSNGVLLTTATSTGVTGNGSNNYAWMSFQIYQDVTTITGNYNWSINNPKLYFPIA